MKGARALAVVAAYASAWTIMVPGPAAAEIGGYLEMGLGQYAVRPLDWPNTTAVVLSAGVSPRSERSIVAAIQASWSLGMPENNASLDAPQPGSRQLWALLPGVEWRPSGSYGRFRSFLGAGLGRASLKNAFGGFEEPTLRVPDRELTATAVGGSISVRVEEGVSGFAMRLGARYHALVHQGAQPASAWAVTVGVER